MGTIRDLALAKVVGGGGGGGISVESLAVTENGTYSAPSGKAYSPVTVNVQPELEPLSVTENGAYTPETGVDGFSSVSVNVSGGGGDHSVEDGIIDRTISGAYENSRVTSIGYNAFDECKELTTVGFSACTTIGGYAFSGCTKLTTVSFPVCKSIGTYAFNFCSSLITVNFPACTSIGDFAFRYCTSLTIASFPACTSIGGSAFQKCFTFISLYLLGSSVANLVNSNVFSSTPFTGYVSSTSGVWGSIYVQASLLETYKRAANWSYFRERFVGVE